MVRGTVSVGYPAHQRHLLDSGEGQAAQELQTSLPPPIRGGGGGAGGEGGVEHVVHVDPLALEGGRHLGPMIVIVNTAETQVMGQAARAADNLTDVQFCHILDRVIKSLCCCETRFIGSNV